MKKKKNEDINDEIIESDGAEQSIAEATVKAKRKGRGLSVGKKVAIAIILVLYVLVIAAVSILVFYRPEIENKKRVYVETITDTYGNVIEKIEHVMTRDEESYNILLLGHDRAAMLTDVFMLINIDNRDHSITIMQVPRDTWISNHNGVYVSTNKINALFNTYYYNNYSYGQDTETAYRNALGKVAGSLEDNLGIEIDYSVIMDLNGFRNIVDILGGVEIYVDQPMYYNDPGQGLYINIPAGYQTLTGEQAEGFVRFRAGYSTADLGRQNAQKQFMSALFAKVKGSLSLTNIDQLTDLANEIFTHIYTDMNAGDLLYFAQCILKCEAADMKMMTMPGTLAGGYYIMNRAAMLKIMNESYHVYDSDLTDGIFDQNQIFNGSSYNYYLPADQVFDGSVYDGEDDYIPTN